MPNLRVGAIHESPLTLRNADSRGGVGPASRRSPTAMRYWFVLGGQAERCFRPYRPHLGESLLLRPLTQSDDAKLEAELPSEGPDDWENVKTFFLERVGSLLVPPGRMLEIRRIVVDVG